MSNSGDGTYAPSTTTVKVTVGAQTEDTHGYWLVGSDGGISFGSAVFHGSAGALHLQRPVVGITPTGDDLGYWLVDTDLIERAPAETGISPRSSRRGGNESGHPWNRS